jgi:hypothetical protein
MRKRELIKLKDKKINEDFSDFELQNFVEEIKEYSNLVKSIGIKGLKLKKKRNIWNKKSLLKEEIKNESFNIKIDD